MACDLWEWDGQQWVEIASTGPPSQGGLPGLAYDSGTKKLVLFGGGGAPSGALQGNLAMGRQAVDADQIEKHVYKEKNL